jgi:hypothetical protein
MTFVLGCDAACGCKYGKHAIVRFAIPLLGRLQELYMKVASRDTGLTILGRVTLIARVAIALENAIVMGALSAARGAVWDVRRASEHLEANYGRSRNIRGTLSRITCQISCMKKVSNYVLAPILLLALSNCGRLSSFVHNLPI